MKIAIDAMGGDNAPKVVVEGAMLAISHIKNLEITLVGDEKKIEPYVTNKERIHIIHTTEVIEGDEEPMRAFRRKKKASVIMMANEVKEKRADACISAGNTGALVVAGLFSVGRMKGIDRPALSPVLPTTNGHGFILMDAGANVDANAHNLLQYGVMGSIYSEKVRRIESPTVGLLNVGTEQGKGSNLTKKAYDLLKNAPIHFVGNVEARDLLSGAADVVVTDGFSGNITLKSIEGTAMHVKSLLKNTLTSSMKAKMAAGLIQKDLRSLKNQLDYSEYGGAALFGLSAPVIKSHGSSDSRAIYQTITQACDMIENKFIETIGDTIHHLDASEEE